MQECHECVPATSWSWCVFKQKFALTHKGMETINYVFLVSPFLPLYLIVLIINYFTVSACLIYLAVLVLHIDCLLPCSAWSIIKSGAELTVTSTKCLEIRLLVVWNWTCLLCFPVHQKQSFLGLNSDLFFFPTNSFKSFGKFLWLYPTNSWKIKLHLSWMMLTKERRIISPLDGAAISNKVAGCLKISFKYVAVVPCEKSWLQ